MRTHPVVRGIRISFRYLNAGVMVCCFAGFGFVLGAVDQLQQLMPGSEDLSAYRPRLTTEIYSTEVQTDGSQTHTLLARVFKEDRDPVELRDVPPDMVHATISIEDRRFYTHRGVSPRDMLRALIVDLRHRAPKQGASTITQQLARNVWITKERTWDRKVKEAMLALEIERKYSKDEIVEMYLNQVCFGHGAFGIKTAARLYFGKRPDELELHECAMIAGLPRWPVGYSPYRYPERCKARRDNVLGWMAREGYITAQQRRKAAEKPIDEGLQPLRERGVVASHAPHFTHMVIRELTREYGHETVYQGGLKVYTTLDVRVQKAAEKALTKGVEGLRRSGNIRRGLVGQGALACVEVRTGRVLALAGGVGPYEEVQYNRAHPGVAPYGRQPGSSFKPYVWASALESGYGPNSVFSADPISISLGPGSAPWTPKNYSAGQTGNYSLRRALAASVNLVSVRLVRKLTISKVQRMAARMLDIPRERLRPFWSIALGASELSPLEQASGYSTFANAGMRPTRRLVRRITNHDGRLLVSYPPELTRVIRPTTAMSMLSMLRTAVQSGTGRRAKACGLPCGGKTGTTNGDHDVWFVGVTPDLSAAVWVGNDNNKPMHRASGGGFCAPIWAAFMKEASAILGLDGQFPEGPGVTEELRGDPSKGNDASIAICVESGLRATSYCPVTKMIALSRGENPPASCNLHTAPAQEPEPAGDGATVMIRVCPSSGCLASPQCPAPRLLYSKVSDAPVEYCPLHSSGPTGSRTPGGDEWPVWGGNAGTPTPIGPTSPPGPGGDGGDGTAGPGGETVVDPGTGGGPAPDPEGGGGEPSREPPAADPAGPAAGVDSDPPAPPPDEPADGNGE